MKIIVKKAPVADTRTCDFTKGMLRQATVSHISDVNKGLTFIQELIRKAKEKHDFTKISEFNAFYNALKTGFEDKTWWEMHQREERHHLNDPQFISSDINLIDVLEQIVDGVMAGLARSGEYRFEPLSNEILQTAYMNTAQLLISVTEITD